MSNKDKKNIHAATDPEKCWEMKRKYGWNLVEIRLTKDKILKVDCVFEGEQTSFEDNRYDS